MYAPEILQLISGMRMNPLTERLAILDYALSYSKYDELVLRIFFVILQRQIVHGVRSA